MSESWFEERVDNDEKGKGKAKEAEKEALPKKKTGLSKWGLTDGEIWTKKIWQSI
jgi:hypothetical protein